MNIINVKINFAERKCFVDGITMTEGDYNTSKMVFDFDIPTGLKMLEMKNPLGEIVYLDEIIDNEVVLVGKAQIIKVENEITYYKYVDNEDFIYWYDKEHNKLYDNEMQEIAEFDLSDYTPVLVNASLFSVAGEYVFEVSLYENDGRLTSSYGILNVAPEQIDLSEEYGETKYPILQDLTNKVAELQEDVVDLSGDISDLETNKQDTLVSGTNIKTINNQSILGEGDLNIDIPTKLSDLEDDSTHRTVTDTEKTTWNNKSDFSGDYNDLQNKPSIPSKTSDLNNDSGFITKDVNNLTSYELKANTGSSIELSINSSTYVVTLSLKNSAGTILNTQTIDLPLESVVVNGSYDSVNKKIVLTLENGNTIDIPVGDLVAGLQSEITNNNKLASDLVDDTNQTNKFVTSSEKSTWNGKYDKPSGGIPKTDLDSSVQTSLGKADTAIQDISGKLDTSKVKTTASTTSGDVYDVTYINSLIGDIDTALDLLNGEVIS